MYNGIHTHPSVFGVVLDFNVKLFFLMFIVDILFWIAIVKFSCLSVTSLVLLIKLFKEGSDNKRIVSFSLTPRT